MNVYFIDENGATGVIRNDLSIEAEEPVSGEVRAFLEETKSAHDEQPVTATMLTPGFVLELYVQTSVRKIERVSTETGDGKGGIESPHQ